MIDYRFRMGQPVLHGREREYVLDALESNQLTGGYYLKHFEAAVALACNAAEAVAASSGTAALHLALLALGVGPGMEVIVPATSFVATANAVAYCGATPVFADVDHRHWCIDPLDVQRLITSRTVGVIAVHLYGHPADMGALLELTRARDLFLLEDAAQAIGACYQGQPVGALGDVGVLSFYGNKIVTTGEGGAVVTNKPEIAARARHLRGQAQTETYVHNELGFNYRLGELAAAVGCAQLQDLVWHNARHHEVAEWYRNHLADLPVRLQQQMPWARSADWMIAVVPENGLKEREFYRAKLAERGIETRPIFPPLHRQAIWSYRHAGGSRITAEYLGARGIVLPTHAGLSAGDVLSICLALGEVLNEVSHA